MLRLSVKLERWTTFTHFTHSLVNVDDRWIIMMMICFFCAVRCHKYVMWWGHKSHNIVVCSIFFLILGYVTLRSFRVCCLDLFLERRAKSSLEIKYRKAKVFVMEMFLLLLVYAYNSIKVGLWHWIF